MKADLILTGGKVVTMDPAGTVAEAVAVRRNLVERVGSAESVLELAGPHTRVVELGGRTVVPGFIDSHSHMISTGARRRLYVDLSEEVGVHSIADLVKRLRERAEGTPRGEWVLGYQEDDSKLEEGRHPTRWELDQASTQHPILVSTVGGHFYMANTRAFQDAGITKETPDPVGGRFDRDPETGELTGGIHEKALDLVCPNLPQPTPRQYLEGAREILQECAQMGITCVYDTVGAPELRAALELRNQGALPIRVRVDINIELFPHLRELGIKRGLGDDWLRICGLKFFFDGAISARTAAVTEEYLNKPGFYGVMATTPELARETLEAAYSQGYRVSCHANGDAAISLYLDIMEELQSQYPQSDPRNRAIHCTVVNPHLVQRIKELQILPTIFGPYPYYHGDKLLPAFGEERLERMFAARSFLDAGIPVAAHSDHPCAPNPPLMGIHALVNRLTRGGKPIGQSQRITVLEAIRLYTVNAAYQQFDENKLGSIEPGKLADMVVLDGDILSTPAKEILETPVDMTIVDGRIVYERKKDPPRGLPRV